MATNRECKIPPLKGEEKAHAGVNAWFHPLSSCCMRELVLNGADWATKDDVYDAFFRAVGAPEWHGHNLDALADSISGGSINQIEVPYRLVIKSYDRIGLHAKPMADSLINLVHELAADGCPVEIRVEGQ